MEKQFEDDMDADFDAAEDELSVGREDSTVSDISDSLEETY